METFEFESDSEPLLVRFDEGNYLLKEVTFRKSLPELVYQAEHDDMIGRLNAVNELRSFSGEKSTRAVWTKLSTSDTFWAVRQAALENIGKNQEVKSVDLFNACLKDSNSKVRVSAIRLLGDLKDPKLVKLFEKTFRSENSYAAQAESLKSIGKCGGKQQLAFLKEAVAYKSYRNIVSKAATDAISIIMKK